MSHYRLAPEFIVEKWLNTKQSLSLTDLKGKVIVGLAFQIECPNCVEYNLPQAQRIHETFSRDHVEVIGLHAVLEHQETISEKILKAFLKEHHINFPVAIDKAAASGSPPQTMEAYHMQATPTLLLIDQAGYLRRQFFGQAPDLALGAEIMALIKQQL